MQPTGKYRPNQKELRGRKKDRSIQKLTEARVRRENSVDTKIDFD